MPAQKRELKRNYIGLVSDETEQRFTAEARPESGRPMKQYILGLLDAMLEPRGGVIPPRLAAAPPPSSAATPPACETHISISASTRRTRFTDR